MRTLESLIKSKGGWKKFSDQYELKNIPQKLFNFLLNSYISQFLAEDKDINKIQDLLFEIAHLAVIAYNKDKKSFDTESMTVSKCIPTCVAVVLALNNAFHDFENILQGKTLKNLEKTKKELETKKENALNKYFNSAYLMNHRSGNNKGFTWHDTPEGYNFWHEIYDLLNMERTDGFKIYYKYENFINAYPECEKEIKEFCK